MLIEPGSTLDAIRVNIANIVHLIIWSIIDGLQKLSLGQFSDLEIAQIVLITASFLLICAFINKMFWWLVNTFIYSLFPDFVINHINKRTNLISIIISIFIFVFILFYI